MVYYTDYNTVVTAISHISYHGYQLGLEIWSTASLRYQFYNYYRYVVSGFPERIYDRRSPQK